MSCTETRLSVRTSASVLLLVAALGASAAIGAEIQVDSLADTTGAGGACSLTEALDDANSIGDTTGGDCARGATDPRAVGYQRVLGAGVDSGAYEVADSVPPAIDGFTRYLPSASPTNADTLVFAADFSEPVQNVDTSDFAVNGTTTATVTAVTANSSASYLVTVSGGDLAGLNGTVGLDLAPGQDIEDLSGNPLPSSEPAVDQTYAVENARCYVDQAAVAGAQDGTSWSGAYLDLQQALLAPRCSEVWVAGGIYTPDASDVSVSFVIPPDVAVYGGFAGTEASLNQRVPAVDATILSGDVFGDDSSDADGVDLDYTAISGSNSYHVVTIDGRTRPATQTTVLDGFTITGGDATGSFPDAEGGGLICNAYQSGQCSPTLRNLAFIGNAASDVGGALYNLGSQAISSPTIVNVTFSGNYADGAGGAIYNDGTNGGVSSPSFTNVTFIGNSSLGAGGAVFNDGSGGVCNPIFNYVTFTANSASSGMGGAMFNNAASGGESMPALSNVILWGDSVTSGEEIHEQNSVSTMDHCVVEGGDNGSNTGTAFSSGSGNLDMDPMLGALADNGGYAPTAAPAYDSPAVDAGNDASIVTPDERGVPRPQGAHSDIGAVESDGIFKNGFEPP